MNVKSLSAIPIGAIRATCHAEHPFNAGLSLSIPSRGNCHTMWGIADYQGDSQ